MFTYQTAVDTQTGETYIKVPIKDLALAEQPIYNKGTAFTERERDELDLRGILSGGGVHVGAAKAAHV